MLSMLFRKLQKSSQRLRAGSGSRRRLLRGALHLEVLEDRLVPSTGVPYLVADINPDGPGSNPQQLVAVSGVTFFAADDSVNGTELWRSDGTEAGTFMLKDITPGSAGSSPFGLTNVNGRLFFEANYVYFQGSELWTSDGTPEGTVRLKTRSFGNLTDVNGTLFFTADYGLWKSDGTPSGTVLVTDPNIVPLYEVPAGITNVNGTAYFAAHGGQGVELWKSDGTAQGTVLVKDINNGATSGRYCYRGHCYHYRTPSSSNPSGLINVNGTLFFTADDGNNGRELWKATASGGARLVKDINSSGSSNPFALTKVNGTLYFSASNATNGVELWKSDGTSKGTMLVKDIVPGSAGSVPSNLTNVNGMLFFTADNGTNGRELWKSNGTAAGTVLVADIQAGSASSGANSLANVAGTLYFAANDGATGMELWQSDGTTTGLVADINLGSASSSPGSLTVAGGHLYFSADDGIHGRELWDPIVAEPSGGYLLVPDFDRDNVLRYDGTTGAFVDEFVSRHSGGLSSAVGALIGPHDGNLYVSSGEFGGPGQTKAVFRYSGATGSFIDEFTETGRLFSPRGIIFGPDGNLYVADGEGPGPRVVRFNGTTGAFIDEFVPPRSGGLNIIIGLVFGPSGRNPNKLDLYVSSGGTDSVLRYDGTTGAFLGQFVASGSGGLDHPESLSFGPDGNLYVADASYNSNTPAVLRYHGPAGPAPGAFMDAFVPPGSGGLKTAFGAIFGPDGNNDGNQDLYVADAEVEGSSFNARNATVKRYDGVTGAFIDTFVTAGSGGLDSIAFPAFSATDPVTLAYTGTTTTGSTTLSGSLSASPVVATVNGAGRLYIPSIEAGSLFEMAVLINADGSASGNFVCHIPGRSGSSLIGVVRDGNVNADGSVTFSGVCSFVLPGGGIVADLYFEVTAYDGGPEGGYLLLSVPDAGILADPEFVVAGKIQSRIR